LTAPTTPGSWQLTLTQPDSLTGEPTGDWQLQGTVEVGEQGDDAFPVPAQLADWHLPADARADQPLEVDLTWRALGKIDAYYSLYVKVLDGQGQAIAGWDGQPQNGGAPTLLWVPGERIEDRISLTLPADAPGGDYRVEVGLYRAQDLARCLFFDPGYGLVDRITLGTIHLAP
jgi:hypothetical protein